MIAETQLVIHGPRSGRDASGKVRIESWDPPARLRRAAKTWAGCWGVAIAAIPFPLLHFVIPPVMVLAGPIAGIYVYTRRSVVLGGEGECPDCGKKFPIARLPNRFPQSDLCTHCQSNVKLSLARPADSA